MGRISPMSRFHQLLFIASTLLASWLGMQAVHEAGHVLGAVFTGGQVKRIVVHPLTISRTDFVQNPAPLIVAWAGPLFGTLFPVLLWGITAKFRMTGQFLLRFFAGFCAVANGAYLGVGSFDRVGDCGDLLNHGAQIWQLWLFGMITIPAGFAFWNGQGSDFGLGASGRETPVTIVYSTLLVALLLVIFGLMHGAG